MENRIILLVEDNPDDVELTIRAFKKCKLKNELVVVTDGEMAMDYLLGMNKFEGRDMRHIPAVILLDLQLPKKNGLEVLKEIRSHPVIKLVPVIILTSSNEDKDLINSYLNGANSYIRKPVDFNAFIDAIQQLGLFWLVWNEIPPIID